MNALAKLIRLAAIAALILMGGTSISCTFYHWQVQSQALSDQSPTSPADSGPVLYFNMPQYFDWWRGMAPPYSVRNMVQPVFFAFQQSLAAQTGFKKVIRISEPPERGLFCSISVKDKQVSGTTTLLALLSVATLTAIPFYDTTGGYVVQYTLYVDGNIKKQYTYEISQKSLYWVGGLFVIPWLPDEWLVGQFLGAPPSEIGRVPLAPWVRQVAQTLASTTSLFWAEGHQDGYF